MSPSRVVVFMNMISLTDLSIPEEVSLTKEDLLNECSIHGEVISC